ncbi:MAG: polyketide synthase [Vicinamibacterales bacterium]
MSPDQYVTVVPEESGVTIVTLSDSRHANALGEAMVDALSEAFTTATSRSETRVILLDAEGETFSAGAPRDLLLKLARREARPADITLPRLLLTCAVPVVAALSGHATGGGFALGLSADLIYLARECRYGFTFMDLGFTPGMGTTRLCEHVLSPALAHELLYTGELRRGAAFERTGVNGVLPRTEVRAAALDVARRIAGKPRDAVEILKRTLSLPRRLAFEQALTLESLMHQITLGGADAPRAIEDGYL